MKSQKSNRQRILQCQDSQRIILTLQRSDILTLITLSPSTSIDKLM